MIELSEAEVKQGVEHYLTIMQNQGRLFFLRLNSGVAFMPAGNGKFYKIQLCPKGTADLMVIQGGQVQFSYRGKLHGEPHGIACVTFIELKKAKGKQSKEQVEFQEMITGFHCRYAVVRSVEELQEVLERE